MLSIYTFDLERKIKTEHKLEQSTTTKMLTMCLTITLRFGHDINSPVAPTTLLAMTRKAPTAHRATW